MLLHVLICLKINRVV